MYKEPLCEIYPNCFVETVKRSTDSLRPNYARPTPGEGTTGEATRTTFCILQHLKSFILAATYASQSRQWVITMSPQCAIALQGVTYNRYSGNPLATYWHRNTALVLLVL
jgi:hypothetical protein